MLARGTPFWLAAVPFLSLISALLFLILSSVYFLLLSLIIIAIFIPVLLFFRDPKRKTGDGVVSPADGRIMGIESNGTWVVVKIFMNIHNVHVNRWPYEGRALSLEHIPGGYVPAFDKESERNERVVIRLATAHGTWEIRQIAGAVARRIVTYVREGDRLERGERFGLIRFGSRVDLRFRLPPGQRLVVKEGQRVLAGSSSLSR